MSTKRVRGKIKTKSNWQKLFLGAVVIASVILLLVLNLGPIFNLLITPEKIQAGGQSGWTKTSVDTTGDVGYFSSLSVDSNDNPHIAYFDDTNNLIKYVTSTSGSWQAPATVVANDIDPNTPGKTISLGVDSNGKVHISYYGADTTLKYATNVTGVWVTSTVDAIATGSRDFSLKIGSNDKVYISYFDGANSDLKYATNATGAWVTTTVDSGGLVGMWSSITLDTSNNAYISYWDTTNMDLKYATNATGAWVTSTVDNGADVGYDTSIVLDSSGKAHISYFDNGTTSLKYATNATGAWVTSTIENVGASEFIWTSIAYDSAENRVRVSYYGPATDDLKYTSKIGDIWAVSALDETGNVGRYTSMAIDTYQDVHISYYDTTNGDLKYITTAEYTAPTITNISSDTANGYYNAGDTVDLDVTFSEAVNSTGNVTVTLETGETDRTCTFTLTSATTGSCNYTVQAGDTSSDLNATISGTIRDLSGNLLTNFTPTTSLATNKNLVIDTTNPSTISNVYDGTDTTDDSTTTSTSELSANWTASTDSGSGIQKYQYAIGTTAGGTETVSWTDNSTNTSVTRTGLSLTNSASYYFTVRAVDGAGNTGTAANSNGITVNSTTPGNGSLSIASGAGYTTSATIDLTISATNATYMKFSNNGSEWTSWETYATSKSSWNLTSGYGGVSADGTKSVYVKFKDDLGNESGNYSDTIIYDTTASTSSPSMSRDYYSSSNWPGAISGTSADTTSGVVSVQVKIQRDTTSNQYWTGSAWGQTETWINATGTTSWSYSFGSSNLTSGKTYTITSKATDSASNVQSSSYSTDSFTYDSEVPVAPKITSLVSGSVITSGTFTLSGTAEASSRILITVYSDPKSYATTADASGNWSYTIPDSDSLSDGEHRAEIKVADAAGNESSLTSISFTVKTPLDETKKPQITITAKSVDLVKSSIQQEQSIITLPNTKVSIKIKPMQSKTVKSITAVFNSKDIQFKDEDGDGIYSTEVTSPVVVGNYTLPVLMTYEGGNAEEVAITVLVDPYGYVYKIGTGGEERLGSAKVTLYVKKNDKWVVWDAPLYGQTNPQMTNNDGEYSFMVPEGKYYLMADKDGHDSYQSPEIVVEQGKPISLNIELKEPGVVASLARSVGVTKTALEPVIENTATQVTQQSANTLAAVTVASALVLPVVLNMSLLSPFAQVLAYFLPFLGRRKRKSWGMVTDSESGQTISLAIVRLFDKEKNKVIETQVTDQKGRFGFLVGPGEYFIDVVKKNYSFPSKAIIGEYQGEVIAIKETKMVRLNIYLDPAIKVLTRRVNIISRVLKFTELLKTPLLIVGTLIACLFYFVDSNTYNLVILLLYALVWLYILYSRFSNVKSFGKILDAISGRGLDLAIVRLFNEASGKLVATRVSDQKGHYSLLTQEGTHHLTITRANYQQYQDKPENYKKATTIAKDFKLKPLD